VFGQPLEGADLGMWAEDGAGAGANNVLLPMGAAAATPLGGGRLAGGGGATGGGGPGRPPLHPYPGSRLNASQVGSAPMPFDLSALHDEVVRDADAAAAAAAGTGTAAGGGAAGAGAGAPSGGGGSPARPQRLGFDGGDAPHFDDDDSGGGGDFGGDGGGSDG